MLESRFWRIIWKINGILLTIVLLAALYNVSSEVIEPLAQQLFREDPPETGIMTGKAAEIARKFDINPQHLEYDTPSRVGNSPYYHANVYVVDRELPDYVKDAIESAGDISRLLIGARVNVLFFHEDGTEVRPLIPSNGYIESIDLPSAPQWRDDAPDRPFGIYQVAMRDTNGDDRIDGTDRRAYYVSDLSGENFRQITPDSLDLDGHWTSRDHQTVFFEEVIEKEEQEVEGYRYTLQGRRIYTYDVATGRFEPFTALHDAFGEIERAFFEQYGEAE